MPTDEGGWRQHDHQVSMSRPVRASRASFFANEAVDGEARGQHQGYPGREPRRELDGDTDKASPTAHHWRRRSFSLRNTMPSSTLNRGLM